MTIQIEILAPALVIFLVYHFIRVAYLRSEIDKYRSLLHNTELEVERLHGKQDGIDWLLEVGN